MGLFRLNGGESCQSSRCIYVLAGRCDLGLNHGCGSCTMAMMAGLHQWLDTQVSKKMDVDVIDDGRIQPVIPYEYLKGCFTLHL